MGNLNLSELGALGHIKRRDAPYGVRYEHTSEGLRNRSHSRPRRMVRPYAARGFGNFADMGDVITDAQTWLTYGNEILGRSSASGVGPEAEKAGMNINTFIGNRGDELQSASPDVFDQMTTMQMNLLALAQGKYKPESVWGNAIDSAVDEATFRASAGAAALKAAPGQAYDWTKKEVKSALETALDVGGKVADKATVPLALIVAGVLGIAYVVYKHK
jgi:hypothetical protein